MWLLDTETFYKMQQAYKAGFEFQKDNITAFFERSGRRNADSLLTINGSTANIAIKGVLTQEFDSFAELFGGGNTTYPDIISALLKADADENVKEIVLNISSGGGQAGGMFDVVSVLQNMKKPTKSVISNLCASAAYGIASQTGQIIAANNVVRIGSIGVASSFYVFDFQVDVASTDAPKKRPDVRTEEGKNIVREELDEFHNEFVESIAAGRGKTKEYINENFGQGGCFLSKEALKRGMIDGIEKTQLKLVDKTTSFSVNDKNKSEIKSMNLTELKAQHPDLYASVVAEGVASERDRVMAHLTMADMSGDTKTAHTAIKDGSGMTATLQATYIAAGMNKNAITTRADDAAVAAAAIDGAKKDPTVDSASAVADFVEAQLGVK